jgi:hypothetical protein
MTAAFSVVPAPMSLDDAQRNAAELVTSATEQVIRLACAAGNRP